jgi:hypothetical protein
MKKTILTLIILIPLIILLFVPAGSSLYAQSKVGTTAVPFLEIGVGPRGVGMGEAYVAAANDVTSLYWNPAGLTRLSGGEAIFSHTSWIAGSSLNYAAVGMRAGNYGYIGVQLYIFDSGSMEVTDISFPDGTGEDFNVQDMMMGITFARQLTNRFAVGGSFKYIQSTIWRMQASSIGLDLGIQYVTPFDFLKLGFSISNFGGEMQLHGDNTARRIDLDPGSTGNNDGILANLALRKWDLPLVYRIGISAAALQTEYHSFILTADALYPNNNNSYLNVGAEYGFNGIFFVRGGYTQLFLDDAEGNIRLGFGLKVLSRIKAEYAYSDRGVLGGVSILGISVNF